MTTEVEVNAADLLPIYEALSRDLAAAEAQLRFRQGEVDDLRRERDALLATIERYAEEDK